MKLSNASNVLFAVVLAATISFAAPTSTHAQRRQADDDQQSSEEGEKRRRARRQAEQTPNTNPNVAPDSIQPRRRQREPLAPGQQQQPQQQPQPPAQQRRDYERRVQPSQPQPQTDQEQPGQRRQDNERRRQEGIQRKQEAPATSESSPTQSAEKAPRLQERRTRSGVEKTTPSGVVREREEQRRDGKHVEQFTATGRKQREEVARPDGTVERKFYGRSGKVNREEVVRADGSREVSNLQLGRDGKEHGKEVVRYDSKQRAVSKTVTKTVTINKTVNKTVVVNHYDRGRYGFVYRPRYYRPSIFISWYDPYWYGPGGGVIFHPFYYSWGWQRYGWYRCYHGPYWMTYDVYPAPSYWVTDYVVAGYLADHYDAQLSVDEARDEARQARAEAEQARHLAEDAKDEAEAAEARTTRLEAEFRAKNAEDKAARLEREQENVGKPNPNATPIDKDTKEALKNQIEKTIAEKKEYAEEAEKGGNPPLPDVSRALAEPEHIYPVSKVVSVTNAKDSDPAGNLSEGDLLKLEPGQDEAIKDASENTLLKMRVMTSKGEEGEVAAGTVVNVSVKDLQDFDNEFRAKLDNALTEADKNKDAFKEGAVK